MTKLSQLIQNVEDLPALIEIHRHIVGQHVFVAHVQEGEVLQNEADVRNGRWLGLFKYLPVMERGGEEFSLKSV